MYHVTIVCRSKSFLLEALNAWTFKAHIAHQREGGYKNISKFFDGELCMNE
jgi:hypothetical protein